MLFLVAFLFLVRIAAGAGRNATSSSQCSCGFRDPQTGELYTESIIMYFNETTSVDQHVLRLMDYSHKNQKGWSTVFRQGASPSNVRFGNNGSLPWQDAVDGTAPRLEMILGARRFDHLSNGAELQSLRRDIMYGSFRAEMRSPSYLEQGSAMSMFLQYNETQTATIDMCNMDMPMNARVLQLINGEAPSYSLATNYSLIEKGDPPKIPAHSPYSFMELRIDWTNDTLDFWINNNRTRRATKKERTLPSVPQTLYFSHWSTGDQNYMQGPPVNASVAQMQWVRAFFNTSLMTKADHRRYDQRCDAITACSVDDMTLRESTEYQSAAVVKWKPPTTHQHIRDVAGYIAAAFSVFGVVSIINALIRRGPWWRIKKTLKALPGSKRHSTQALRKSLRESIGADLANASYPGPPPGHPYESMTGPESGSETPAPGYTSRPGYLSPYHDTSGSQTPLPAYESGRHSPYQSMYAFLAPMRSLRGGSGRSTPGHARSASAPQPHRQASLGVDVLPPPMEHPIGYGPDNPNLEEETDEDTRMSIARNQAYLDLSGTGRENGDEIRPVSAARSASPLRTSSRSRKSYDSRSSSEREHKHRSFMDLEDRSLEKKVSFINNKRPIVAVPENPQDYGAKAQMLDKSNVPDAMAGAATAIPAKEQLPHGQAPQQRIDYLAGLVALCCIMVTLRHFSLTFWPYITTSQGYVMHFRADLALSYVLGPYVLTPLWIGPFFVTSCRFLAQRYLKTGKLNDIANKMLLRAPRMLIPVFVFMTLEYFLISLGLTSRLEWLPSVSYSTWPYVTPQPNFGVFLNEAVEISYITPNAAPEVINHYCVGVLWTIPVQLQFSFVTLLATVLIKDVKTPWKRFSFYTFTIICGWYGQSWSACHWLGLMLADLDITYDWKKWIYARWWRHYGIITMAIVITLATPLALLFNSAVLFWSFMSWENAIHPNPTTGRPIYQSLPSIWWAYPQYYEPNLAILTFSLGLQLIVELSTWTQKALSIKIVTFFHPHIMTIYLMHGFVFWSVGASVAVWLSGVSLPYWAILIVTALFSYSTILFFTVIMTPLIEFATKGSTKNIWRWATEEPVPHRRTTAPFTKELVLGRMQDEEEEKKANAQTQTA
ncbi:hypothetical protein HII31_01969 [Pseudocercospora fuligena]|uniref:GH16 domain-containing protein n=1 Tax=Pseudocercospora fuligena TaxID=685502 RepID=A0A8H6RSC4_9PEZI|nr:hypothetical protein HII31_01969 [Pseudocercospora fuligena]